MLSSIKSLICSFSINLYIHTYLCMFLHIRKFQIYNETVHIFRITCAKEAVDIYFTISTIFNWMLTRNKEGFDVVSSGQICPVCCFKLVTSSPLKVLFFRNSKFQLMLNYLSTKFDLVKLSINVVNNSLFDRSLDCICTLHLVVSFL